MARKVVKFDETTLLLERALKLLVGVPSAAPRTRALMALELAKDWSSKAYGEARALLLAQNKLTSAEEYLASSIKARKEG